MNHFDLIQRSAIAIDRASIEPGDLVEEFIRYVPRALEAVQYVIEPSDRVVLERYVKLCLLAKLRTQVAKIGIGERWPLNRARRRLQWAIGLCAHGRSLGRSFATLQRSDIDNFAKQIADPSTVRMFLRWLSENGLRQVTYVPSQFVCVYKCASDHEYRITVDKIFAEQSIIPVRVRVFIVLASLGIVTRKLVRLRVRDIGAGCIYVDNRKIILIERICLLLAQLSDERLMQYSGEPPDFDDVHLFACDGSNVPPSDQQMGYAMRKEGVKIREFRNAAKARLSHDLGILYAFAKQVGQSDNGVVRVALHHKSRAASYAISLARSQSRKDS